MKRRLLIALSLLGLVLALPLVALGDVGVGSGGGTPGTSLSFQFVGHNDLSGHELDGNTVPRGMNSQVTIYGHYAYIGNRTDGSSTCGFGDPRGYLTQNCPHPHPGILIADIADPANPTVVGEIGPPYAGQVGITTRELRVWPQKKLLMVMTFRCSSASTRSRSETARPSRSTSSSSTSTTRCIRRSSPATSRSPSPAHT